MLCKKKNKKKTKEKIFQKNSWETNDRKVKIFFMYLCSFI